MSICRLAVAVAGHESEAPFQFKLGLPMGVAVPPGRLPT